MGATDNNPDSILINDVLLNGKVLDIFIRNNRFESIGPKLKVDAAIQLDGRNKAILPSFANSHTRAALSLMRGFTEELPAHIMQRRYLSPLESCFSEDDVYWGTKLACLEMIKTGTTFFADMYLHWWGAAKAVQEMGLRSVLSIPFEEHSDQQIFAQIKNHIKEIHHTSRNYSDRISLALAPVSITELSRNALQWLAEYAARHNLHIHTTLSFFQETAERCLAVHGKRPVHFLDEMKLINTRFSAVHALWLDERELEIMAERGASIVHCPTVSMKLATGEFASLKIQEAGVPIFLGTDSANISNHQNMLQEIRMASLLANATARTPLALPAKKSLEMGTQGAAALFGIENGEISQGKLADCILVNLNHLSLTPNHNDQANLAYGADSGAIDTTICNGCILMHNRVVKNEEEILKNSQESVARVLSRLGRISG